MIAQVRLKEQMVRREASGEEGARRRLALAFGLALLETGTPPVPPGEAAYLCETQILSGDGIVRTYVLRFEMITNARWTVHARLAALGDPVNLPTPTAVPASRARSSAQPVSRGYQPHIHSVTNFLTNAPTNEPSTERDRPR